MMQAAGCIDLDGDGTVGGTMAGQICSFYYLQHATMDLLMNHMTADMDFKRLLLILASAPEYDELPVRPALHAHAMCDCNCAYECDKSRASA
jgi:pre-mRNA-splicing helicase BRR2